MDKFDVTIIGAGVIGLAIARQLAARHHGRSIVVLEQESGFGQHISSRNSEVIHAGIYYPLNSLKAKLCLHGKQLLYEHCERHLVPYKRIGKFIVAQTNQVDALERLAANAAANGVADLQWVDGQELAKAEPAIRAHCGLYSPSTGIVDSHAYMQSLLHLAEQDGALFAPNTKVEGVDWDGSCFVIDCAVKQRDGIEPYRFQSSILINCAGLNATSVAALMNEFYPEPPPQMYPCKGDYFVYSGRSPLQHLVYPLPEKNGAGLGIHATLDLTGQLRFGPDANFIDDLHYRVDADKRSLFAAAVAEYLPSITPEQLLPAYAGIRPKLAAAGSQPQDFKIVSGAEHGIPGLIQLFGIESPGLTASLAIGEHVTNMTNTLL